MPQSGSSAVYTVPTTSLWPATFSALLCTACDLLTFESDESTLGCGFVNIETVHTWNIFSATVLLALSSIRYNRIRAQNPFLNLISFTGLECPITNIVSRLI